MRCHAAVLAALLLAGASCASAAYSCDATTCKPPACLCGSSKAPGGLTPEETPQFVLITHDDAVNQLQDRVIRTVTDGFKNPNGCNVPATWFAIKDKTSCEYVKNLVKDNHEIAGHTLNHTYLYANLTVDQVTAQLKGIRDWMVDECGVPAEKFRGFRAPYLVHNPQYRTVLASLNYTYDSSILEAFNTDSSPTWAQRLFPYTMDAGIPQDCSWSSNSEMSCAPGETHPGLWEVPVWFFPDAKGDPWYSMDYGLADDGSGNSMPKADLTELLKKSFDEVYAGNRAPFPFFMHAPWFTPDDTEAAIDFVKYAQTKDNVWFVTMSQLIDWMKNLVPASQMNATMKCDTLVELTPPKVEWCRQYKVGPVEDIWTIGARFGVSKDDLLTSLNPGVNIWNTPEGTIMKIPPWDDRCDKPGAAFLSNGTGWYNPVYTPFVGTGEASPAPAPTGEGAPTAAPGPAAAESPVGAPTPAVAAPTPSPAIVLTPSPVPVAPFSGGARGAAAGVLLSALAGLAALALLL